MFESNVEYLNSSSNSKDLFLFQMFKSLRRKINEYLTPELLSIQQVSKILSNEWNGGKRIITKTIWQKS